MATLTMYEVNGTNVTAVGYTAKGKELSIEFKSGKVYTFYGVPKTVFTAIQGAEDADLFFKKNVKGQYDYAIEEVDTDEEEVVTPKKAPKAAAKTTKGKPAAKKTSGTREPAEHQSGVKGINWHKVLGRWVSYYRNGDVVVRVGSYALNELKKAKAELAATAAEYEKPVRKSKRAA